MDALGVSANVLSNFSGVNPSQLSQWFKNKINLTFRNTQILNDRMRMLEELAAAAAPLPLNWYNTEMILALGDKLRQGKIKIRVTDEDSVLMAGGMNALAGRLTTAK